MFILVQCNTSLELKLCCSFICYCSLCDMLNLRKNRFVCARWPSVHMKSVAEQGFSTNSHSTTKCLKHLSNFEYGENVRSLNIVEFEFRHIPITNNENKRNKSVFNLSYTRANIANHSTVLQDTHD